MILALINLKPNAKWKWVGTDYNDLEWLDEEQTKPSLEELQTESLRLAEIDSYKKPRAIAYPSIQEQLDMQYWDSVNGTTVWLDTIAAIKAQYPKS